MVRRDHSCQTPFCIKVALPVPCPKCNTWQCQGHMPIHSCKRMDVWQTAAPSLNAMKDLQPDDVKADGEGNVEVHLPFMDVEAGPEKPKPKKPSSSEWRSIIEK